MKLVVGCYDGSLHGWESKNDKTSGGKVSASEVVESLSLSFAYKAHRSCTKCISLMAEKNGDLMASGGTDEVVRVYNLNTKREIGELDEHTDALTNIEFIGKKHMISGSMDGSLCLWQTKDWQCLHRLKGHKPGPVTGIAVHPSGNVAFSTSRDNSLRLWDLTAGRPASRTRLKDFKEIGLPTWAKSGNLYSVVADDRAVLIFNIDNDTGKPDTLVTYRSRVNITAFLSDEYLAVGCEDGSIRMINLKGEEMDKIECSEKSRVRSIVPLVWLDTITLAVALSDGKIQFWSIIISKDSLKHSKIEKELNVGSRTHVTCMTALMNTESEETIMEPKKKKKRRK